MKVGLVGLGKMGSGMAWRLTSAGHQVVGCDPDQESRDRASTKGISSVPTLDELLSHLDAPRVVWLMLPAGSVTRSVIDMLATSLDRGDCLIDGGNSDFREAKEHAVLLDERGIEFVDVGVSGGQWGWQHGYGLMVGASPDTYGRLTPILDALAPVDGHRRVGGIGSGHLAKALHNGVQYGLMQAYAEGFALLEAHEDVDTVATMTAWQGGSSVRSWLLEQMIEALKVNPALENVSTEVPDSGMGRWTSEQSIRLGVSTPVLTSALYARFASRSDSAANRLLRASRAQIGGQP